jgi:hypothetical protein
MLISKTSKRERKFLHDYFGRTFIRVAIVKGWMMFGAGVLCIVGWLIDLEPASGLRPLIIGCVLVTLSLYLLRHTRGLW